MDPRYNKRPVNRAKIAEEYKRLSIESAGQLDLLILTYDAAIKACDEEDHARLSKALHMLKGALKIELDPELTIGLLRNYLYCEHHLEQNNFEEVRNVLVPLRNAWFIRKYQGEE